MKLHVLAVLALLPAVMFSQETRGTISGSVTDNSGAAIAKAKVTITETRTGSKTELVRCSVYRTALHATSGEPAGESVMIVISTAQLR